MSAKGVKAGEAYVELGARESAGFDGALEKAKQKFKAWGASLASVGGAMMGAGASILGPMAAAVASAMGTAGELDDISQMTGASVESLSALGFAAKMSGTDLGTLHKGLTGLAKFTAQVASGGKGATDALNKLGISSATFMAATPEQRLALIADGLKNISDPALKSAMAMQMLGKSGEGLIPMLAGGSEGLREAAAEATRLGLIADSKGVSSLAALGDAWDILGMQASAFAMGIGTALADTLVSIAGAVHGAASAVIEFVQNNQSLVLGVAAVGAGLATAGVVVFGLGAALAAVGVIIPAIVAGVTAFGAALAVVFSPMGLLVGLIVAAGAAIVGGIAYWAYYSETVQTAVAVVTNTVQGLWAALSSGNWGQAATIGAAAFNAAWQTALLGIKSLFGNWATHAITTIQSVANAMAQFIREIFQNIQQTGQALQTLPGMKGTGDAMTVAGAMGVIGTTKAQAAGNRGFDALLKQLAEASPEKAAAAFADLNAEVAQAKLDAAKTSEERAAMWRKRMNFDLPTGVSGSESGKAGTLGTFSGSVAGLLGRSLPSSYEAQTAKNTGDIKEGIERIVAGFEGGDFGVVFGA